MSEPVTKTVCSNTFSFRSGPALTGVSASEALAAIRIVTPAAITLFTTQNTPARSRLQIVKESRTEHEKDRSLQRLPEIQKVSLESELELLRQARVPEPVRSIVSEAWITDSVSAFAEGLRRVLIKDIVASNSDARALE